MKMMRDFFIYHTGLMARAKKKIVLQNKTFFEIGNRQRLLRIGLENK
jgi:hypothetical protein